MEGSRQPAGGAAAAAAVGRNSMDYSLAALKLFGSQLTGATEAPSSEGSSQAQMLYGIRFQRAWLQGVIVMADYRVGAGLLLLDDGSCVAELTLTSKDAEGQPWRKGMYVMVIGSYVAKDSLPRANRPVIKLIQSWAGINPDLEPVDPLVSLIPGLASGSVLEVHKLVDLSAQPDREAMWYMEVAEAYNFFYLQLSAASSNS